MSSTEKQPGVSQADQDFKQYADAVPDAKRDEQVAKSSDPSGIKAAAEQEEQQ